MQETILKVDGLSIRYDENYVIDNLSFYVSKGEKTVITGESGKGKSSLINALLGFVPFQKGNVGWFGKSLAPENITSIRNKISWLPQDTSLFFNTGHEMIETVFGFKHNKSLKPTKEVVENQLKTLGLQPDIIDKHFDEISGGQKQRLLLAGILLLKKTVLILDEPTSDLDESNKKKVTDLILNSKGQTVIAISHDPYWIDRSDKIIAL